jgi:hypothetical protein
MRCDARTRFLVPFSLLVLATPGRAADLLVKVHNESGVTAELKAESPNAAPLYQRSTGSAEPAATVPASEVPHRWADVSMASDRPLSKTLSSLALEYRVLQIYSRDAGKREARIGFRDLRRGGVAPTPAAWGRRSPGRRKVARAASPVAGTEAIGAGVGFLPPYSSDLNPIEKRFS